MMDWFSGLNPVLQALIATFFTWGVTALGAGVVFFRRRISRKLLDSSLGFSAGVMISASFFSLILPALEMSAGQGVPRWLPVTIGFLLGAVFLRLIARFVPHLHFFMPESKAEGIKTKLTKTGILILAMTIHNFPEGLAVGVAFGSVAVTGGSTLAGAMALALGIAIQNFPEGMAISLPLLREGKTKLKSFYYGQLSAVVEPAGGVIGASLVLFSRALLPYALSFAAGAMIFVVVEELIPESQSAENTDLATMSAVLGFAVMMVLDVAFG